MTTERPWPAGCHAITDYHAENYHVRFDSEAHSCIALEELLDPCLWNVRREVRGEWAHARHDDLARRSHPRIDYVIEATEWALGCGWPYPRFGIEAKSGGQAIGPAVSQAIDYATRATFDGAYLDRVFLWPADVSSGALGSIIFQQRLGVVKMHRHWPSAQIVGLDFGLGIGPLCQTDGAAMRFAPAMQRKAGVSGRLGAR